MLGGRADLDGDGDARALDVPEQPRDISGEPQGALGRDRPSSIKVHVDDAGLARSRLLQQPKVHELSPPACVDPAPSASVHVAPGKLRTTTASSTAGSRANTPPFWDEGFDVHETGGPAQRQVVVNRHRPERAYLPFPSTSTPWSRSSPGRTSGPSPEN